MLPLTEATTSARAMDESRRSAEVIAAIEEERLGSFTDRLKASPNRHTQGTDQPLPRDALSVTFALCKCRRVERRWLRSAARSSACSTL